MPKNKGLSDFVRRLHSAMIGDAAPWFSLGQQFARLVMPTKADTIYNQQNSPNVGAETQLFDATGIRANQVLANGMMSYMTPASSRWFSFDPPASLNGDDEVKQWFRACSEIAQREMAGSNFYSEIHEFYLDNGAFGTSAMIVEEGRRSTLRFEKIDYGSFYILEDDEGFVDTLLCEFEFTPEQAAKRFGEAALSPKMKKILEEPNAAKYTQKHKFVRVICPRSDNDRELGKIDAENKPVASVYCEVDANYFVVRESGYDETPFVASRFAKWNASPYGKCPTFVAYPDLCQLNFLQMQMDALAELSAFPRMIVPDTIDVVDYRASGVTYIDSARMDVVPKEWGTVGRYDIGIDRVASKQKAIEQAFFVDMFQMFANLEKGQMTAREVAERASEKLVQFSPSFDRKTTEVFNPLLKRVFSILIKAGKFPPPPQAAIMQDANGAFLPEPDVVYSSRIALAIKSLQNMGFIQTTEMLAPMFELKPDMLDNWDFDTIVRDLSRNNGEPAEWLIPEDMVAETRAARAQQQAQMAQAQQAEMMAGAAAKAGSIKSDSVVGQAIEGQS